MVENIRAKLRERIEHGATLEELEMIVLMSRGLTGGEREDLWRYAWAYEPGRTLPEPAVVYH